MKQYFVGKTTVALYYDIKNGAMDVPLLGASQDLIDEKFSTTCKSITTNGNRKFVFSFVDGLSFGVVCDDKDETTASLAKLLELFSDLLRFRIQVPKENLYNRNLSQSEIQKILEPVVKTMSRLSSTNQSVLVQGIEYVELSDHNREMIEYGLEVGIEDCANIIHAVLFVGTKIAAVYSKPKIWKLKMRDLLCLMIYAQSVFVQDDEIESDEDDIGEILSKKPPPSKREHLWFHTSPNQLSKCLVHLDHEEESNMTLVLICNEDSKDQDKLAKEIVAAASKVHDKLKTYTGYLKLRAEEAHITMLHYLHYCPGLIHFIFIDKVTYKVIAPKIVPLNSVSSFSESTNKNDLTVEFIKSKIWEMSHICQEYKNCGYTEVGICCTGIQYWFKEYIEDNEPISDIASTPRTPRTRRWDRRGEPKRHYELYTMYLPYVSSQAIAKYNKILVSLLLDSVK